MSNSVCKGDIRCNTLDNTLTYERKYCPSCGETKSVRDFYFVKTTGKYKHCCKVCWIETNGATSPKRKMKQGTNTLTKFMIAGTLASVLGACSKQVPPDAAMTQEEYTYKVSQVEKQIEMIPDWYTAIPEEDNAVYAVGTAITPDMQLSVDIAVLAAKTTLADRINSKLRSQIKTFKSKLGADDFSQRLSHEFEQATSNLIADADVAGYSVKENIIVQNGTQYRAYVLLEYTDSEAAKIIKNRVAKDEMLMSKLTATQAWKDLDAKVDAINEKESNERIAIIGAIND